jgi:hypothetical protein
MTLPRDTDETPFTAILALLLTRIPGAYGAALVDGEGETVDYSGTSDPFDLRIAAAHVQLLLQAVGRVGAFGEPRFIVVRGTEKSILMRALPEGYALSILLRRRAGFSDLASRRALSACERLLAKEAGWTVPKPSWAAVEVLDDSRGRPITLGARRLHVEVMGALVGLPRGERGFRVRTNEGDELTVVREPNGVWYADEDVDEPKSTQTPPRR